MSLPTSVSLASGAVVFEKTTEGKWIESSSTVDEPTYLNVKSDIRPNGISNYLVQIQDYDNGTEPVSDTLLQVHVVIKGDTSRLTAGAIASKIANIEEFLTASSNANLTRMLRGEL